MITQLLVFLSSFKKQGHLQYSTYGREYMRRSRYRSCCLYINIFTWKGFEECVRGNCPVSNLKSKNILINNLLKETAVIETRMAGKSSLDQANRRQKLGLVWRIRKKISQIIKDYFYLPFFLLIILCPVQRVRDPGFFK
jgi:hypothetical protein